MTEMISTMSEQAKRARLSIVISVDADADAPDAIAALVREKFEALGTLHGEPREITRRLPLADEGYPDDYRKVLYEADVAPADG